MRFSPAGSRVSNCTSRGVILRNAIVRSTDLKPATWPVANWGMGQPQRKLSRTPVPNPRYMCVGKQAAQNNKAYVTAYYNVPSRVSK